jgi:small-conductance mechanosensitive channel
MEEGLNKLLTATVLFVPTLVASVAVFVAFWIAAIVTQAVLSRLGHAGGLDPDVLNLGRRVAKIGLLVFGGITALGTSGINVSALVAGLGLTGFALGFALKDILSNFLAGTLILTYRPFRRNDRVSVAGVDGVVTEIDLRYTTLHNEQQTILIPNSTLFTNIISVTHATR